MPKNACTYVRDQRGSVLIEFSLIAVSLSLLIALVVDVARMVFISQILQESARVAAREMSLLPLSPSITFEEALQHPHVKAKIFDSAALVIAVDQFENAHTLEEFLDGLPIVNRMLRPLMRFERIMIAGRVRTIFRFPGVVLGGDHHQEHSWSIGIPHTGMSGLKDLREVRWKSVMEEIRQNPQDPRSGSFSVHSSSSQQLSGLVALRINYPFQPMFMNWLPHNAPSGSLEGIDTDQTLFNSHGPTAVELYPIKKTVIAGSLEEYQRIIFGQAVFRREVFQ